jgi:hypothetical protein
MRGTARALTFSLALLLPLLLPVVASADAVIDRSEMFSDKSLNEIAIAVLADEPENLDAPQPRSTRTYWTMAAVLTLTTVYDVESTFRFLEKCMECTERNPIVKPFVDRGRLATYAFSAAVNAIVLYVARRMYMRGHDWWYVFPTAVSAVHGTAGSWNFYRAGQED